MIIRGLIIVVMFMTSLVCMILGIIFDADLILFGIGLALLDMLLFGFFRTIAEAEKKGGE